MWVVYIISVLQNWSSCLKIFAIYSCPLPHLTTYFFKNTKCVWLIILSHLGSSKLSVLPESCLLLTKHCAHVVLWYFLIPHLIFFASTYLYVMWSVSIFQNISGKLSRLLRCHDMYSIGKMNYLLLNLT